MSGAGGAGDVRRGVGTEPEAIIPSLTPWFIWSELLGHSVVTAGPRGRRRAFFNRVRATLFHDSAPRPATRYPGGTVDSQERGTSGYNPDVGVNKKEDGRAEKEEGRSEEEDANGDTEGRAEEEDANKDTESEARRETPEMPAGSGRELGTLPLDPTTGVCTSENQA
ncbi:hypothetical protein NDU88_007405 [Pleurodeles waltl]|uniref:Uncharacterized protein n=1 Tax=Pleurodeles waltl TaxID=8319 RepID=A0AAV7LT82_PLEWA|nr:hypothetical protein NDU88_007405 [Pleurodeles waltl]